MKTIRPDPKTKSFRLKGKAKTQFRKEVCERAGSRCESCGRYAPLLDDGVFNVFTCGHTSHRKSIGAGGSDTIENTDWLCYDCHINKEHGPKWSKKK